jgi:hypothetical protein
MNYGREDKNPWVKWFWQDYDSDTGLRSSSLAAQGLWMRMLSIMAKSRNFGFLLDGEEKMDSKTLAKQVGESQAVVESLIAELFQHGVPSKTIGGIIFNRRMARESSLSELKAKAGRLGASKRWQKDGKPLAKGMANPMAGSASASSSLSSLIPEDESDIPKKEDKDIDPFEVFWKSYPRRVGKADAFKAWMHLIEKEKIDPTQIQKAVEGYIKEIARLKTELQYVKHPTTFLRSDRWKDYLPGAAGDEKNEDPMDETLAMVRRTNK